MHIGIILVGLLLLSGCSGGDDRPQSPVGAQFTPPATEPLHVTLEPSAVVGGSTATFHGHGEYAMDLDSGAISRGSVDLILSEADSIALRLGAAGEEGPILARLEKTATNAWLFPPAFTLSVAERAHLDAGGLYLEAYTPSSPDGAARGQLEPNGVTVGSFNALGMQMVPPAPSAGSASIAITHALVEDEHFFIHVNIIGIDDVTDVHLHSGVAGENGPVVAELMPDPDTDKHWSSQILTWDASGVLKRSMTRTESTAYIDVHTLRQPDGELRGQIVHPETGTFHALRGADVVPAAGSTNSGMVAVTTTDWVGWDWIPEVTVHVNLPGIDDATSVHLRQAAVGQNGPLAYPLERDPNDPDHWSVSRVVLDHTMVDFGGYYVSVQTPRFPEGELRAQLITRNAWPDREDRFAVTAVIPGDGALLPALPPHIEVRFNRPLNRDSVRLAGIRLQASGNDGSFAEGNEITINPVAVLVNDDVLTLDLTGSQSTNDVYRLILDGSGATPVVDFSGERLHGYLDYTADEPSDFVSTFAIDAFRGPPATLQTLQANVFTPSCAIAGCHEGPRPPYSLDLTSGRSFRSLLESPGGDSLVQPGDPDSSRLVRHLRQSSHARGQMRSSNATVQLIREWIADGAQDN
jgi:hypothetical protein